MNDKMQMLIKELQLHANNEKMNVVIEEKMTDMWREALWQQQSEWGQRMERYGKNVKRALSKEQYNQWDKSHIWYGEDESDTECQRCHMTYHQFFNNPEYCEEKEVSHNDDGSSPVPIPVEVSL